MSASPLPAAVVVVGGAGCLGRTLVRRWSARRAGPQVVSLDLRPNEEAAVSVVADLSDVEAVERRLFQRFAVKAMVVAVKPPLVGPSYQAFIEVNVSAVCELVRLAERYGVGQLVYASSIACSNHWVAHHNVGEADPSATPPLTELASPYDLSKSLAEEFILRRHSSSGLRTVSLRLGGVYGNEADPYWHRRLPFGLSLDLAWAASSPQIDSNFTENIAEAMLRVADVLAQDASVGGRFYFYTHGDRRASQQEISMVLARKAGRLHVGVPFSLLPQLCKLLQWMAALPLLLPGWPLGQRAGRAVSPKPYFSMGSFLFMGFVEQAFDNSLFRATFGYSHVYTVDEALEHMHQEELRCEEGARMQRLQWYRSQSAMLSAAAGPLFLCLCAAVLFGLGDSSLRTAVHACIALSSPATHILASAASPAYKLWQPFHGGALHVVLQGVGWSLFSLLCCQWLLTLPVLSVPQRPEHLALLTGDSSKAASGVISQVLLASSLLAFQGGHKQASAVKAE